VRRLAVLPICAIFPLLGGCGDGGASAGATVSVYVGAPLCAGAKRELAREGGRAGDLRIRAVCLPGARHAGELDLAALGANARRATEDSSSVAFLEGPDPRSARFTRPILESAGIPSITASSGTTAMGRTLRAIAKADPSSLRESLRNSLSGS
jgi:hypothetical protein